MVQPEIVLHPDLITMITKKSKQYSFLTLAEKKLWLKLGSRFSRVANSFVVHLKCECEGGKLTELHALHC